MTLDPKHPERYPLDDIVQAIWDRLDVVPAAQITKGDQRPMWHKGSRWLRSNERRPPSYVWFRGRVDPNAPFKGDIGQYQAVASAGDVAFFHSWGGTEAAAWAMQHNLVSAARALFGAGCIWRGSDWFEPDDQGNGAGFVTTLVFAVPVIGVQYRIAVPEDVRNQAFITINGVDIPATGA
ncbi:hypothetical protein [Sorangium sp. So ce1024]|uniref:hypothetical protein n=1 Tax=Sorangium sp. So ce1024 TaxID=3133327 RepID=UPI003F08780E